MKSQQEKKKKQKISSEIEFYQKNINNYVTEIIIISLQIAPIYFRNYIISQNQKFLKYPCLSLICENIVNNEDLSIRNLVIYIKILELYINLYFSLLLIFYIKLY